MMCVCVCVCVCVAANVNDRSMTGERDSEVAIRFEDKELVSQILHFPSLPPSLLHSLYDTHTPSTILIRL